MGDAHIELDCIYLRSVLSLIIVFPQSLYFWFNGLLVFILFHLS